MIHGPARSNNFTGYMTTNTNLNLIIFILHLYEINPQLTQTDRFALSSLQKQGSRNVMDIVDSRFRGNDKLCHIFVMEQLTISLG
jgi:hypothetical protein